MDIITVEPSEHRTLLQRQLGLILLFKPSTRLVSLCYVVVSVCRSRLAAACHPVLAALASERRLSIQNKDQPALSHLGPI